MQRARARSVRNAAKGKLFLPPSALAREIFNVSSLSFGYVFDIPVAEHVALGFGATGSVYALPNAVSVTYGSGVASYMIFSHVKIE